MKSAVASILFVFLLSSGFGQSILWLRSDSLPFRVALDGRVINDSALFQVRIPALDAGSHLMDVVVEDENQSQISTNIRLQARSEAKFKVSCSKGCALYPERLVTFDEFGYAKDTVFYKALKPLNCGYPMVKVEFDRLESKVRTEEFEFRKEAEIRVTFREQCLSVNQILALLRHVEFEDKRLELLSDVKMFCTDPENLNKLSELFLLQQSKTRLESILRS
jgi:hypothetical protein